MGSLCLSLCVLAAVATKQSISQSLRPLSPPPPASQSAQMAEATTSTATLADEIGIIRGKWIVCGEEDRRETKTKLPSLKRGLTLFCGGGGGCPVKKNVPVGSHFSNWTTFNMQIRGGIN